MENPQLKRIYNDIIRGYSVVRVPKIGTLFVKHLTQIDYIELDDVYFSLLTEAAENKILTYKEKVQYLINEGLWTKEKEKEILDNKYFLDGLKMSMSKVALSRQLQELKNEAEKVEKKIGRLELEKSRLIGYTAESYASSALNDNIIKITAYRDKQLQAPFYTDDQFDDLSDDTIRLIWESFNQLFQKFKTPELQRVALSPFFLNFFYMSENNPHIFYGKPIVALSFYQLELFAHGMYFKNVLSEINPKPPDDVMNNPEKLIEYFNLNKNSREILDKQSNNSNAGVGLVGATKEDYERLGISSSGPNLLEAAQKQKGGSLQLQDILKIQGV